MSDLVKRLRNLFDKMNEADSRRLASVSYDKQWEHALYDWQSAKLSFEGELISNGAELLTLLEKSVTGPESDPSQVWDIIRSEPESILECADYDWVELGQMANDLTYESDMELCIKMVHEITKTEPEPLPVVDHRDEVAKKMYYHMADNHPTIHTNRFPLWDELGEDSKEEWRAKVKAD